MFTAPQYLQDEAGRWYWMIQNFTNGIPGRMFNAAEKFDTRQEAVDACEAWCKSNGHVDKDGAGETE